MSYCGSVRCKPEKLFILFLLMLPVILVGQRPSVRSTQVYLDNQVNNVIKTSGPSIGCWFWMAEEFKSEGYKKFIDAHEKHSPFSIITASLRHAGELTDPEVHSRIKAASVYAQQKGMGIVMDLDLRLAREAFMQRYPNEMQEIVLLREFTLSDRGNTSLVVKSPTFHDHYTYGRQPYYPVSSKLLRIYSYKKEDSLVKAGSLNDITARSSTAAGVDELEITINGTVDDKGRTACALVAVTVYMPDVFAPHLLSYQREILVQYADASLAGAAKDEWGFPGRVDPSINDLWYSSFMADAYAKRRPGKELLRDMFLMSIGETGRERERIAAVNHYMEMNWKRNVEIETDYYHAIKEILGNGAMSGTHPTWYPFPNSSEVLKNGLSWWGAKRDIAQTDEGTPFCVRTALAKKAQSPVWYNMYYTKSTESYPKDLWISALGGGRLNYHPPFPTELEIINASMQLLEGDLLRAESRVKLLNYISTAPIDCPVAVVFGHPAALNWSLGESFADVGLAITNGLWKEGFYADLIPSTEILNGSMKLNKNGKIQYGPQEYEVVLYYHPETDYSTVADFFKQAGEFNKTKLIRVGNWTKDFEGNDFDGDQALPASMEQMEAEASIRAITSHLKAKGSLPQTPSILRQIATFPESMMPLASGNARLIDGTIILASGENDVMGDPINKTIDIRRQALKVDAIGLAAMRLDEKGKPEAMAFGGLKSVSIGSFKINLPVRMDIAIFKEAGKWRGIVHGYEGRLPRELTRITKNWTNIRLPVPYSQM